MSRFGFLFSVRFWVATWIVILFIGLTPLPPVAELVIVVGFVAQPSGSSRHRLRASVPDGRSPGPKVEEEEFRRRRRRRALATTRSRTWYIQSLLTRPITMAPPSGHSTGGGAARNAGRVAAGPKRRRGYAFGPPAIPFPTDVVGLVQPCRCHPSQWEGRSRTAT